MDQLAAVSGRLPATALQVRKVFKVFKVFKVIKVIKVAIRERLRDVGGASLLLLLLFASYFLLFTSYFLLLASYFLLFTSCFLLLTSYFLLLVLFLAVLFEGAEPFGHLRFLGVGAGFPELRAYEAVGKVLLLDVIACIIMCIFILFAVTQFFH